MKGPLEGAARRPVAVLMVTVATVVFGIISYSRLDLALLPDLSYPTLTVRTEFPGAGPRDVDKRVTEALEKRLATTNGLVSMTSVSRSTFSDITLEFRWDTDMTEARADVESKIDAATLPEEAARPLVLPYDPNLDPILRIAVSGRGTGESDLALARKLAEEEVEKELKKLKGVAAAKIRGGREREIAVHLDDEALLRSGIGIDEVANALLGANRNEAAGLIQEGPIEYVVRSVNELRTVSEIEAVVVKNVNGVPVRVRDVGRVEESFRERELAAYVDGKEAVLVEVYKKAQSNVVAVSRAVRERIEREGSPAPEQRRGRGGPGPGIASAKGLREALAPWVDMKLLTDQSRFIEGALDEVRDTAVLGGILAVLVLYLFLRNAMATLVAGAVIPVCAVATFAPLFLANVSLNIMSLGGLALGVGMMVDNAIVVLENIVRVRKEENPDRSEAAVAGTGQVWAAIVASTLTTLVVFLPLVFVRGQTGLLFRQLGYVVSFSLVCSLVVALTLVPMLAARMLAKGRGSGEGALGRLVGGVLGAIEEAYRSLLAGAVRWRWLVLPLVALAFYLSLGLSKRLGTEFLPATDEGEVRVTAEMEVGTRIDVVDREVSEIERIVREEVPEALHTTVNIGPSFRSAAAASEGEIRVTLVPATERGRSSDEIAAALRKRLAGRPGMVVRARAGQGLFILRIGFEEQNSLVVDIRGHEFETLYEVAQEVRKAVAQVPGVVDVRLSSQAGAPETLLRIDRDRAADLGLTVSKLARTLETAIAGSDAGDYREGGDEVRILLKVAGSERMAMDEILDFTVPNDRGEQVVLRNVVDADPHRGPVVIDRKNQQRLVIATAGIEGRDLGSVARDVQEALRRIPMPRGYETALAGDFEEQQEAFGELMMGLLLSLLLVYMVMACLYESLVDPLVVMFSVPLAAIGVVVTLFLTDTTFNVQSFIGCIMLGGIVVNNAILIVDQASALRREGHTAREAVVEAGRRRLRPILMTTLTTVLGLLPLALGIGEGAEAQAPMARAVVGGLTSSTLITLVVVPIVYLLFHRDKK